MILGQNIDLRNVEISDAEFILSLRLDPDLNRHLSEVEDDISKQRDWIEKSRQNDLEWYFIVQNKDTKPVGTIRIYNIKGDTFCWGSWIIVSSARKYASFESAYLLYKFAFEELGFAKTTFDVRKENLIAINFHKNLGSTFIKEDDLDIYMMYTRDTFEKMKNQYIEKIERISSFLC
ncbi:GNAT family N-acetyltransferase [Rickettsiaceae bacterium]|nr:GNAT family N-acetyltransferase [Rickettsiaceae bacterium]